MGECNPSQYLNWCWVSSWWRTKDVEGLFLPSLSEAGKHMYKHHQHLEIKIKKNVAPIPLMVVIQAPKHTIHHS